MVLWAGPLWLSDVFDIQSRNYLLMPAAVWFMIEFYKDVLLDDIQGSTELGS